MSFSAPKSPAMILPPPVLPPAEQSQPTGEKPKKKSMQPSLIGAAGVAPNTSGGSTGKTLLGQ